MIVADVNLLVYLIVDGDFTAAAERVYRRDRRWIAPRAHRFELLNVLATHVRAGRVPLDDVDRLWRKAWRLVATPDDVDPLDVLRLSVQARLATYDCEYVVLARQRRLRVVTNDGGMLSRFTDSAVSIEDFAAGR